ncbi:MAG: hypothetical protein KTR31_14450 [Myxococcales bacterium]|nr:hypothetical protein [Myxococcales bacterium]
MNNDPGRPPAGPDVFVSIIARLRAEEANDSAVEFDLDSSIDGPPPRVRRPMWSPRSWFTGLALFSLLPLAAIYWMLG